MRTKGVTFEVAVTPRERQKTATTLHGTQAATRHGTFETHIKTRGTEAYKVKKVLLLRTRKRVLFR